MTPQPREQYLATEVMTASPQRLHLMLIEGALRFLHKARQHWAAEENELARQAIVRARKIVADILAGFERDLDPGLVNQVASLYAFVYRTLIEATFRPDDAKLADVLRVFEIERDTWRRVCDDLAAAQSGPGPPPLPPEAFDPFPTEGQRGRLSFEA